MRSQRQKKIPFSPKTVQEMVTLNLKFDQETFSNFNHFSKEHLKFHRDQKINLGTGNVYSLL